jgi:hypothetical protein
MNRNTYSGSPAVKTACPNRGSKSPFRHSRRQRANLQNRPQWAPEELCTPTGPLRRTNPGWDIGPCCQHFHPRPTSFRCDQINKARTLIRAPKPLRLEFLRAQKAFSLQSPIAHGPFTHRPFWSRPALRVFRGEPRFQKPQSAIIFPPYIGDYRELSAFIFSPKTTQKTNH